jgi:hypothetical protein
MGMLQVIWKLRVKIERQGEALREIVVKFVQNVKM